MDQEGNHQEQKENQLHNLENEKDSRFEELELSEECMLEHETYMDDESVEEIIVRPAMFYVLLGLLIIVLIGVGIGSYLFYPFSPKISGTWGNPELGMNLSSEGKSWTAKIENYQGVKGYTFIYKGQWQAAGINTYEGKQTKVQILLDKQKIPETEISALQKENPLYKKITDDKKILHIEYTESGMKKIFGKKNIDDYFHFTLEPISFEKSKQVLYLNHAYFSSERLPFVFNK
ncbi:hypothetical protein [Enterococcus sp. DIV0724b]|uniref:hypothetical protein n=1 Tax=Enterococcus sp. DIV0724b TaxID=2774694 RepID=UPI003D3015C0